MADETEKSRARRRKRKPKPEAAAAEKRRRQAGRRKTGGRQGKAREESRAGWRRSGAAEAPRLKPPKPAGTPVAGSAPSAAELLGEDAGGQEDHQGQARQEHCFRRREHSGHVQQHAGQHHRHARQSHRLVERRPRRFQRFAQEHGLRRATGRAGCRAPGDVARHEGSRNPRQRPRFRPRIRHPRLAGHRA